MPGFGFGFGPGRRAGIGHNGGPALSPLRAAIAQLFASGAQGGAWDVTQPDMLFQDAARTVPVTGLAQPCGGVTDLSPNGNHLSQGTGAARTLYTTLPNGLPALLFDGNDDFLTCASLNLSGTDKVTVFAAIRILTSAGGTRALVETSTLSSNIAGTISLYAPRTSNNFAMQSRGTGTAADARSGTYTAPVSAMLTGTADIAGQSVGITANNDAPVITSANQGTGNFGNHPLFVGGRAGTSLFYHGYLASLVIIGRACTPAEIAMMKAAGLALLETA